MTRLVSNRLVALLLLGFIPLLGLPMVFPKRIANACSTADTCNTSAWAQATC